MRVLVTGAAGFIGYHLCKRLKSLGYEVTGVDDFNAYYDPELKRHRARLLSDMGVEILESDFENAYLETYHLLVHLAAHAGVRHSMDKPMMYIKNNIVKTQALIDKLQNKLQKKSDFTGWAGEPVSIPTRVIYASTSCVMAGNPLPWKEDEPTGHQLNPYGYTKRTNECQFRTSIIPCTIGLRFFTVYGPLGRPDMALFDFTRKILLGEPIQAFNNGHMVRDFTYVDDIIDGIMLVIEKGPMENHHIFNIGRGRQVELMDFIREIERATGTPAKIEMAPRHPADTLETWADTRKIGKLGYSPKVDIPEGVDRFVRWYREYFDR